MNSYVKKERCPIKLVYITKSCYVNIMDVRRKSFAVFAACGRVNGKHRRKQNEDHAEPYGLRISKISAGI